MPDDFDPYLFDPPIGAWDVFKDNLVAGLPVLIAQLIVIIIVICFIRRHTKAAVLLIIAVLLSITLHLAFQPVHHSLWESAMMGDRDPIVMERWMKVLRYTNVTGYGIVWLLIAFAVFVDRRTLGRAQHQLHTTGKQPMMDTPPTNVAPPSGAPLHARPISKGAFLGTIIAMYVISTLMAILGFALVLSAGNRNDELLMTGGAIACASFLPLIVLMVMIAILVYKLWAAIQSEYSSTTPGLAVGLLFVPFFNLYWIFRAYYSWAKDFNSLVRGRNLNIPQVSESLALTICILGVCGVIPYIGILFGLVNMILLPVFFNSAINGVNQLAAMQGFVQPKASPYVQ